jgi:hypothetical protein
MFVVMGFGVAFGFISINIRNATDRLTESQVGYYKYTMARNLARIGLKRTLRYIDMNPTVANYTPPTSGSFNNGSYRVETTSNQDTMWINVTGSFADTNYIMKTKLLKLTKPFPVPSGAMTIRASPLNLGASGQPTVDGRNYDSSGTNLDPSCPNKPAFSVLRPADSTTVVNTGGLQLYGSQKAKVDSTTPDPDAFIDEYEANADIIFRPNPPGTSMTVSGNQTLGTATNPKIIICDAGADTNFTITFSGSITGWGILAIRGNVIFKGTVDFHGLVVAYGGNNSVTFAEQGTPSIVGGVIVAGSTASLQLKGTGNAGKTVYSCQALKKASNLAKLRYYGVLEWYE